MTFFEWFYKAIIIQGICVLLVLLSLITVKFFWKDEFLKMQSFYEAYIAVDTDINEVLSDEV